MLTLRGLPASTGIAIGRSVCVESRETEVYRVPLADEAVEGEIHRYRSAAAEARGDAARTRSKVRESLGEELAGIFEAHALLLGDATFHDLIEIRIREKKVNAEWAVRKAAEELVDRFSRVETEHLRHRAEDLQDVSRYLLRRLQGTSRWDISEVGEDVIVLAEDLTPSDAVRLGRKNVTGLAIETGGMTSHTAIIAHSLRIPLVAGVQGLMNAATVNDPVIVDGSAGLVVLQPTADVLAEYELRKTREAEEEKVLAATSELDSVTRDGQEIRLAANIDLVEELEEADAVGASGIGLYRSEFLYIERSPQVPSEEEHLATYRQILEYMAPRQVVIRTYDLGGRKIAREVMGTREENPVLGLRGIRLTLARPSIFRTQVRALLRAGLYRNLGILLPMISSVDEIHRFRAFASEMMDELESEGVPHCKEYRLGVMIEVPAAALIADHLARAVDFFSLGTNDLIQYALAVDRSNDQVSEYYRPLHPSILRMVHSVLKEATVAGIPACICGEMAADPVCASVLVGLGARQLSMSPRYIPRVKQALRSFTLSELENRSLRCLNLATAAEVARELGSDNGEQE